MSDPKRQWYEHHNYTADQLEQIGKNLIAKILVSAIQEDEKYLNVVAPGSRVGPLLKDCLALSLRAGGEAAESDDPILYVNMSEDLRRLLQAEIEAEEEKERPASESDAA